MNRSRSPVGGLPGHWKRPCMACGGWAGRSDEVDRPQTSPAESEVGVRVAARRPGSRLAARSGCHRSRRGRAAGADPDVGSISERAAQPRARRGGWVAARHRARRSPGPARQHRQGPPHRRRAGQILFDRHHSVRQGTADPAGDQLRRQQLLQRRVIPRAAHQLAIPRSRQPAAGHRRDEFTAIRGQDHHCHQYCPRFG